MVDLFLLYENTKYQHRIVTSYQTLNVRLVMQTNEINSGYDFTNLIEIKIEE